jgi:pilus assembly protein Flp/PilA
MERQNMRKFMKSAKGAALVEYGILVGLIAVLAIGAVLALGEQIEATFSTVEQTLEDNMSAATN